MNPRLLLIDDEETILFALRRYFTSEGYEVDCASGVSEAEQMLDASKYSAVIADVALTDTGREGLALAQYARRRNPACAIVLLTAHTSAEVETEAFRRGADRFVHKPQPLVELAAIINAVATRNDGKANKTEAQTGGCNEEENPAGR